MALENNRIKKSKNYSKLLVIFFLCIIFIFPTPSYEGAKRGLLMWFDTVLPTLLPFIIISNLIIGMQITRILSKFLYPFLRLIFKVSPNGSYPILIGFLSGIPVGAKATADLVERGDIGKEEGQYLLSFCNNPSPMFIMSFIAISQLKQPSIRFHLLIINLLSAILGSFVCFRMGSLFKHKQKSINTLSIQELTSSTTNQDTSIKFDFGVLDKAIMDGFEVLTKVGGYIILFSIPAEIISSLSTVNYFIKVISLGLLEITTGINHIANTSLDLNTKIILIVTITAFGGLSGMTQTKSVISNTKLSIVTYFKNKIVHMLIAFALATLYINLYH